MKYHARIVLSFIVDEDAFFEKILCKRWGDKGHHGMTVTPLHHPQLSKPFMSSVQSAIREHDVLLIHSEQPSLSQQVEGMEYR